MRNLHLLSTAAALLLCASFSPDADAAFVSVGSGPANYCQPALPAHDGLIRTRPLAIQNVGATNAFVTCSMPTEIALLEPAARTGSFVITLANKGAAPVLQMTCTAVAGSDGESTQTIARQASVTSAGPAHLSWFAGDFAKGAMPELVSFSCLLPPGGAITATRLTMKDGTAP
jgi:hypothetical protein